MLFRACACAFSSSLRSSSSLCPVPVGGVVCLTPPPADCFPLPRYHILLFPSFFSRFFVSGDLGRPLFCTSIVSRRFSSSRSADAAPFVVGEIGNSIACNRAVGAASLSEMMETMSELIAAAAWSLPGSGGGSCLDLFCCSCSRFPSLDGLLPRHCAYSYRIFGASLYFLIIFIFFGLVFCSSFPTACSARDVSSVSLFQFPFILWRVIGCSRV